MRRFLRFRAVSVGSSTCSIEGGRTIGRFHIRGTAKRRGGNLPARLRFSAHRGVTLIELMISMLILTLVCVAWLEIIGIQSAKKEARRREAVERLAGKMDAFMYEVEKNFDLSNVDDLPSGAYVMLENEGSMPELDLGKDSEVCRMFEDGSSPIGYQLIVDADLPNGFAGWNGCRWLEGRLYSQYGVKDAVGRPFFTLRVCLGL